MTVIGSKTNFTKHICWKKRYLFYLGVAFRRAQFEKIMTPFTIFKLRWFAKHPRLQNAVWNYRSVPNYCVYPHYDVQVIWLYFNNHINANALSWRSKRWLISGHDIHIRFHSSPYLWVLIYARDPLCFLKTWQSYYNMQSLKPRGICKL